MMSEEKKAYTTITVTEYNRMGAVIRHLRWRIQQARESLEKNLPADALNILKSEEE